MRTGLFYLKSNNLERESLDADYQKIMDSLIDAAKGQIVKVDAATVNDCDVLYVFVSGGGTENVFKTHLDSFSGMVYLIATNGNNSLAASMEILSYLTNKGMPGQIIHDVNNDIVCRVMDTLAISKTKSFLENARFARVGEPSDWLISSGVDAGELTKKVGTELVDVPIEELIDEINAAHYDEDEYTKKFMELSFDEAKKNKALNVYGALKRIIAKYELDGLTVRCFDLLDTVKTTSCVALSLLNAQGIYSSCEGDVPSLMSMAIINQLTGAAPFQANPSVIDKENNSIIFAHCTLPFNMCEHNKLDTHYESGIGVALKSQVPTGDATLFKCSGLLDRYFVSDATIIENLDRADLCRTQIVVIPDKSVDYFFERSIGNHHIIVNGKHADIVDAFFNSL